MTEKCTWIIEIGIIGVLIYLPVAFGGVSDGSIALMEIVVGLLMLVWLAKLISQRHEAPRRHRSGKAGVYHLRVVTSPVLLPCCVFVGLIFFQLLPLPASVVNTLSPATYRLYADAAATIDVPIPAWMPLSVCAHATKTELHKLLAYLGIFFLIINTIRSPRQITRLVYVIIAVGLFEALYGMLEFFSGHHQIFGYQKTTSFTVSGTFINKNHFAGYLEMVIPLSFSVLFVRLGERSQNSSKKFVRFMDEKYMKAALISFVLLLLIGALFLSGSRGGVVSFFCGMLCLSIFAYKRRILRKQAIVILVLLIIAVGIAVFLGFEVILTV